MEPGDELHDALPPANLVGFRPAEAAILFSENLFGTFPLVRVFNQSAGRKQSPALRRYIVIES